MIFKLSLPNVEKKHSANKLFTECYIFAECFIFNNTESKIKHSAKSIFTKCRKPLGKNI
jgi:hypothetical protein